MTPHYADETVSVFHGDCLDVLAGLPDASVDAVVTDPPYGLGFMGKAWDALPPGLPFARECLRVLKPGGHMLAFGGTRTWHRLACAVEDAGFEIRDCIAWMYGSGFPKSLDVSKAIDKAAGAEGTYGEPKTAAHAGWIERGRMRGEEGNDGWQRPWMQDETALSNAARKYEPGSDAAREWQGWGTALKPAFEPIVVARKPLTGTVAANVLTYGTGALNIDACRIEGPKGLGRWPANVVLDEDQAAALDTQSGDRPGFSTQTDATDAKEGGSWPGPRKGNAKAGVVREGFNDTGGASRFFYVAKADATERPRIAGTAHPTVKPLALMRWLIRLVTPPGGVVLEPFAGSGTTIEACILEGFRCIAIEKDAEYLPLIEARIHRRRNPLAAHQLAATTDNDEANLFDLLGEDGDHA